MDKYNFVVSLGGQIIDGVMEAESYDDVRRKLVSDYTSGYGEWRQWKVCNQGYYIKSESYEVYKGAWDNDQIVVYPLDWHELDRETREWCGNRHERELKLT